MPSSVSYYLKALPVLLHPIFLVHSLAFMSTHSFYCALWPCWVAHCPPDAPHACPHTPSVCSRLSLAVLVHPGLSVSSQWFSSSVQFSSVTQSYPTFCDHMDCSTSGLPVHHQLPEFTQARVHWVGDAIRPSHPLLSPSPPAFNLSHHQGLFQRVSSLHEVDKYWSFSFNFSPSNEYSRLISFRMDWLDLGVQKHQFFGPRLSL